MGSHDSHQETTEKIKKQKQTQNRKTTQIQEKRKTKGSVSNFDW